MVDQPVVIKVYFKTFHLQSGSTTSAESSHNPQPLSTKSTTTTMLSTVTYGPLRPLRVNGHTYLLTFAALTSTAILPARMFRAVKGWSTTGRKRVIEWLGSIEKHANPAVENADHHWHVYVRFESRLDIANHKQYRGFDIELADGTFAHPDIAAVKLGAPDRTESLLYVAKDQGGEEPQLYGCLQEPIPNFAEKYRQDAEAEDDENTAIAEPAPKKPRALTWGDALNLCHTEVECERMLRTDYAKVYYLQWSTVQKHLRMVRFKPTFEHMHTLGEFTVTLQDFGVDWKTSGPVVVVGPTGIGKTSWVAAHAINPKIVKNIEDVKAHDPGCNDLLIFDDVNFSKRTAEWIIALLDFKIDRTVDARHQPVKIPRWTPMIFTTNFHMNDWQTSIFPPGGNAEQDFAIERRFRTVRIPTSLFH